MLASRKEMALATRSLWNIPNILTVSRVALIPVLLVVAYSPLIWRHEIAAVIFAVAAITDWFDGYLARIWNQTSNIGKMLDPIADKLLIASVLLLMAADGTIAGWSIWAAITILCREILVSGLREYLGAAAGTLKVTRLSKWKTTAQMVAIAVMFLGTGLEYLNGVAMKGMTPEQYVEAVSAGLADPIRACGNRDCASYANLVGIWLLWLAAALTLVTGWEYFVKSLPFLREDK